MTLGDGIRRNIASVDPSERALLIDAFKQLNDNNHKFPGNRTDSPAAGGVTWWFKQDEIHQATHVHGGVEFLPWHREIVNRMEQMLRQINPQLSLHYWDWTQDPTAIPNANLGGGVTGTLNLFTQDLMGYGGTTDQPFGEPWLSAGYYVPGANPAREDTDNPADSPDARPNLRHCWRHVNDSIGPATNAQDNAILSAGDFVTMNNLMIPVHNDMHGFVAMGPAHRSFEDPFVFLLHSNVDRLFARWQTDPAHPERLSPDTVYGTASGSLDALVEPWSTGFSLGKFTRPWCAPENQGVQHTYKHPSIVTPPQYDTNFPIIGQGVLTQFGANSIVGVAGFYGGNIDNNQHVIVGTTDGRVHELWWQGPNPVGQGVLTQFGAGGVAGFYGGDTDQNEHAIVGTTDGRVHELFWQ